MSAAPFIRVTTVFSVFRVLVQGKVRPDGFLLDPLTRHEEQLNTTPISLSLFTFKCAKSYNVLLRRSSDYITPHSQTGYDRKLLL